MKTLFTLSLLVASLCSFAQHTAKDFFADNKIVWYGIDYSKARFVGSFAQFKDAGDLDGKALVDKYFPGWNNVVIHEPKKYDVALSFHKQTAINDLAAVTKINAETNPAGIMQENPYTLDAGEVPGMVAKYSGGSEKDGIAAVFIAESYDHSRESGSYYVVVFDIATKKVLIQEKYSVKPGGFGVRNYWAKTVFETLKEVADGYGKWKKNYGK
jgi:hypothetical protein